MTSDPPVYLEQPRQRWLRPDAWRFAPPNAPERPVWARGYQEPAWLQAQRDRETLAELKAEEAQVEADARAIRLELASMRHELALLKRERKAQWQREIAARREANERAFQRVRAYLLGKANFNPEQPRDEQGRWSDGGGDFPGRRSPGRMPTSAHTQLAQFLPSLVRPLPLLSEPPVVPRPVIKPPLEEYPTNPKEVPPGFMWRGQPGTGPGDKGGSYIKPKEPGDIKNPSLRYDEDSGHGPHWDYRAPDGKEYRWYPDGTIEPKDTKTIIMFRLEA